MATTGLGRVRICALQVEHVQARHAVGADVAGVAAHALIAAGAERQVALAGEDDHADLGVLAGVLRTRGSSRTRSAGGRRCAPRAG
jgi:hypothetical protein